MPTLPKPPNPSLRFRRRRRGGWRGRASASAAVGDAPPAGPAGTAPAPAAAPAEWKITLDAFNIHEGELHLTDAVSKLDYSMTGIAATVEGVEIPQQKDRPINLWLTVDNSTDGGWIRAKVRWCCNRWRWKCPSAWATWRWRRAGRAQRRADHAAGRSRGAVGASTRAGQGRAVDVSATGAQAELTQFKARDESLKPALDVALQRLHLTADRLAMGPGQSNFTLDADGVQGQRQAGPEGVFTPQPLTLRTSVDLSALNVASFAPYFASSLNATVRAITLGAKGEAAFAAANGKAPLSAAWKGGEVTDLDLQDRVNKDDFLNWKRLAFSGMDISVAGDKIGAKLGDIALDDFYGRILLNAQGRLNVMDLVAAPGQAGGSITQEPARRAPRTRRQERRHAISRSTA